MEVGQNCRSHTPLTPPTAISLPPRCIQGLICMVIVNTVKQQQTLSSYDQTGQYGYQSPCNMCTCVCGSICCCPTSSPSSSCPSSPVTTSVVTVRRGDLSVEEPKQRRPGRRPISELMAEDENSCITLSDKGNGYSTGEGRMCILVYRQKIRYAGAAQVKIFVISICQ
ncbi:uncharacterized protein LOC110832469 isoform X1 [Zootermopsis nevadensis]|uniref:uncharacterized protein LOC110832469 isoform X1 n=1 Tax=Zootermopsis nevadensis TaxID=136037 RepID=UPI000B8E7BF1|nr:uncharacterized protein LOC110832469 isoform X1 [Zootermopsis nevadensis]XP_021925200.1 uncharacterized protein LOC110832469 isoform X1 [Zootermopsis nevadensis]XP_021925209.1 uncharacterized protein LOC110832469 isoform X1 [Zootermopsis nevadensis]XP_021925220.1 uncharacterized protein LOC110832469 isoform X1 [Zootermopsis nevadensis]XP_021925228.1 uncharacterized protein LOC110832469 isoform X1 [Zootermopsis nevadensis]